MNLIINKNNYIIIDMKPLIFFNIFICLLAASDCNLDRFPPEINYSQNTQSELQLENYILDDYPILNDDFNHPLKLFQNYSIIDSSHFIQGILYPYYVKALILEKQKIQFQKWNLETQLLQNISSIFQLSSPQECHFYSIDKQWIKDVLIHCENSTHLRQYEINNLFRQYCHFTLLTEKEAKTATDIIFLNNKLNYYYVYRLVRKSKGQIIQLYQFSSFCTNCEGFQFIEDKGQAEWVSRQTGLNQIQYLDYLMLETSSGLIEVFCIKNDGILLRFQNYYYDRWYLQNQTIVGMTKIQYEGGLAVITQNHLYFLSINQHQTNQYRLVFKQLSRTMLQANKGQLFGIGEYAIIADGMAWNVYYLLGEKVKHFAFPSALTKKDIKSDNYHFIRNSFFSASKHYILQKPSLKLNKPTKQVVLRTNKCSHSLKIKFLSNSKVEVTNQKSDLVWNNGRFENLNDFCVGNNVSSSLFLNSKNYNTSKINFFTPNIPKDFSVINFTQITSQLLVIVVKNNEIILMMSCFKLQPCLTANSQNQTVHSLKFMEARLNLIDASYETRFQDEFLFKEVLLTVVWDLKYFYTIYDVYANKIILRNGWESVRWKFKDFEMIGYSSQKRSYCSKSDKVVIHFAAYSENKWITNNWAHSYYQFSNAKYNAGTGFIQNEDIMFGYMKICSIFNYGMEFLLYKFEDGSLKIKSIYDQQEFYLQKGFATFHNIQPGKAICSSSGLVVFNNTQLIFINSHLAITQTINFSQNIQKDKISGQYLLHFKDDFSTEIYYLNTGFLITSLSINIEEIIAVKQETTIIGLKNGTFIQIKPELATQFIPQLFTLLNCFNGLSLASKLISIKVIASQFLPQPGQVQDWSIIDKNIWSATVSNLKGVTPLSKTSSILFFTYNEQRLNIQADSDEIIVFTRQIYGQRLQIMFLNYYCMRQVLSNLYTVSLTIEYGNSRPGYFEYAIDANFRGDIMLALTNFDQNTISIIGYNQSSINIITLSFDSTNLSNVQLDNHSCNVDVWLEDDFSINRRAFKNANKIYQLRYQIQLWHSKYQFTREWTRQKGNQPRRKKSKIPKIQIFTLLTDGQCFIQELISEHFGLNEEIQDFIIYQKQAKVYLLILTTKQLIVLDEVNRASNISISLNQQYSKLDVRHDFILLISNEGESQVFHILWQEFPYAGTLQLVHTLPKTRQKAIGGIVMERGFVLASSTNLILYLKENKKQIYSIQNVKINTLLDDFYCRRIQDISFKNEGGINVECSSYGQTLTFEIGVLFALDVSHFEKIIVENQKETKEYFKKTKRYNEKHLSSD